MLVEDLLMEAQQTFKDKGEEYGHTYTQFADVILALFPEGLPAIKEWQDINKLGVLLMIIHKLIRYCSKFPEHHNDSIKDLIVYAAIIEEIETLYDGSTIVKTHKG